MLPPVEKVLPTVEQSRRTVLWSVVPLGLLWAEKAVPVVMAPEALLEWAGLVSSVA